MVSPARGVQVAPDAEGEAVVGAVPEECAAEAQLTESVADDELVEPLPRRVELAGRVVDHLCEHLVGERLAEHRDAPEQAAIACREPVDACGDHLLDRVRQLRERLPLGGHLQQFEQEQRVACRALDQRIDAVLGDGCIGRRQVGELGGLVDLERSERDAGRVLHRRRRRSRRHGGSRR